MDSFQNPEQQHFPTFDTLDYKHSGVGALFRLESSP